MVDFYWRRANQDGKALNKTIGELEKCIAIDNDNALFHFFLGRTYLRKELGKVAKQTGKNRWVRNAIDEFHRAIELKPSASDYHFHLGISYGSLDYPPPFYRRIIQDSFQRTVMLNPTDVRHLYSIGTYYLNEYDRLRKIGLNTGETSTANYKNHMEISKDNYQFFFRKLLEVDDEYLTKILKDIFSVTKRHTDLKTVIRDISRDHALFARFLNNRGMWEEARNEYMMAIKLAPSNPIRYAEFANAFSSRRDFGNAITWWQKQKIINPQDERIYLSLSYGFMRLNRFDDALRELHELIKLNPENINYQVKLIMTLLASRRVDEAIDEYYELMEKNQNFPKSAYDTIRHYQREGDYSSVTKILKKALTSTPNR
jgi:tetratricopeptide (TPR) repeat protein